MSIRTSWRELSASMKTIVLIASAITATGAAWPWVEPAFPAHRQYVRETAHDLSTKLRQELAPVQQTIRRDQIARLEERQRVLDNEIARWDLALLKATEDPEKVKIIAEIAKLRRDLAIVTEQVRKLNEGS